MAYKLGHCTQTGKELLIKDARGKFSSAKKDAYQADLKFENGGFIRILLSKEAVDSPDFDKIYEEMIHPGSESFAPKTRAYVAEVYGKPVALTNIKKHPFNKGV